MSKVSSAYVLTTLAVLLAPAARAADMPATVAPAAAVAPAPFFAFQDTTISYRFEPDAREPGVTKNGLALGPPANIQKNIAALTHVDSYKYGTNFANVDFLSSNAQDPAAPNTLPGSGMGALEIYALYRGSISGNAVTNSHTFAFGPVKDISLGFGGDINTKDTLFAPRKRDLVAGPQVSFDVQGFLTIEANVYKEWNHNSFGSPDTYADFRAVPEFEATYLQPLDKYVGIPLSFGGFANVVLPKGSGGTGSFNDTRTEFLTANRLTLDASKYLGFKTHVVDIFVGHKYWLNKFGVNHNTLNGAVENTFFTGAAIHTSALFGGPFF